LGGPNIDVTEEYSVGLSSIWKHLELFGQCEGGYETRSTPKGSIM